MPSLEAARRMSATINNGAKTIGQIHKNNSDFTMEYTWDSDIQSKVCFIYDHIHDDSPELNTNIQYDENTTKTKIDAKFIISSYGSIDKSQVAYHLMFKPSQKLEFEQEDELYYYETDYRSKFGCVFPISLYVDIPDEKDVYHRWLIVDYEESNQFMKYQILPCDYRFQWIQIINGKKYKKYMWGCIRGQNSYTSGIYTDHTFTRLDNVDKFMIPLNSVTEMFGYNDELNYQQRLVISAKVSHPNAWEVSKIENTKPFGILQVTVKQCPFDLSHDKIEYDSDGNITDMWCDYYSADGADPVDVDPEPYPTEDIISEIFPSSPTIKVGGSYRTITAVYHDHNGIDVSDEYAQYPHEWRFFIDDEHGERVDELITVKQTDNPNVIKIKFIDNKEYINKRLYIDLFTNAYIYGRTETPLTLIG